MQETWAVYSKYAMGSDELAPVSLKGKNPFGNLGAMIVDSLDTLWMFGLKEEFQECASNLQFSFCMHQSLGIHFTGGHPSSVLAPLHDSCLLLAMMYTWTCILINASCPCLSGLSYTGEQQCNLDYMQGAAMGGLFFESGASGNCLFF